MPKIPSYSGSFRTRKSESYVCPGNWVEHDACCAEAVRVPSAKRIRRDRGMLWGLIFFLWVATHDEARKFRLAPESTSIRQGIPLTRAVMTRRGWLVSLDSRRCLEQAEPRARMGSLGSAGSGSIGSGAGSIGVRGSLGSGSGITVFLGLRVRGECRWGCPCRRPPAQRAKEGRVRRGVSWISGVWGPSRVGSGSGSVSGVSVAGEQQISIL